MVVKGLVHATPSRYLLNQTNLWAPGSVCKAGLLKHGMHRKNRLKSCNFSVSPTGDDSTNRKPGLRRSKIYQHRELKPTKNGDFGFRASSSKGKLYPENMWSLANEDWECDRGWWNVSPWPISCGTSKHFALRRMAVARWASQLAKWPFPGNPNNYDLHCQVPIYIYIYYIYIYILYIYIFIFI